ncbi:MAG: hypothetical protein HQL60_09130 [Magnetococcales bacterium]|nr:hypothetical protein [Magnetococcales bacterium]
MAKARINAHLDQAAETEKRRIAGEIHDELGGTLAAIRIALTQLEKQQTSADAKRRCQEISALAHHAQQAARRIATSIHPEGDSLLLTAADNRGEVPPL